MFIFKQNPTQSVFLTKYIINQLLLGASGSKKPAVSRHPYASDEGPNRWWTASETPHTQTHTLSASANFLSFSNPTVTPVQLCRGEKESRVSFSSLCFFILHTTASVTVWEWAPLSPIQQLSHPEPLCVTAVFGILPAAPASNCSFQEAAPVPNSIYSL